MAVSPPLQNRLDLFREKKKSAIRENDTAVQQELKKQRDRSTYNESLEEEGPKDDREYTLQEWKEWAQKKGRTKGGYKNLDELAHATYEKEIAGLADKEKYAKLKEGGQEDIESMVQGLQEASERRLKKRRKEPMESNSVNEKNRQFNMKLEREAKEHR